MFDVKSAPLSRPLRRICAYERKGGICFGAVLDDGFTLIEILAVLMIVGVILSVAVIRIGGDGQERILRDEAERLSAVSRLVAEKAILDAREFGVRISPAGYQVLSFSGEAWRVPPADRVFRERVWPDWFHIQFMLEGERVVLTTTEDEAEAPPQILFLSSGEITPFRVALSNDDGSTRTSVIGDENGLISIQ